ncbi:MAG: hypothetical protein HRU19_11305 [Pseudobacteriovorax sp.]|nr:hypothetical protein [Pseudobacteriovorax sp.]
MRLSPLKLGRCSFCLLLTLFMSVVANAQEGQDTPPANEASPSEEITNAAKDAKEAMENKANEAADAKKEEATDAVKEEVKEKTEDAMKDKTEEPAAEGEISERRKRQLEALPDVGKLADKPKTKEFYSAIGAGKTLPEGVMRVRLPYQNVYGKEGFDEEGNKESQGYEINIDAMAAVAEYGLTDRISLALIVPFVLKSQAGLNANEIRKNNRKFKREFGRYAGAVKALLKSQGFCSTDADCYSKIYSDNYTIPVNQTVTLTTGETVLATTDEPVSRQIDNLLMTPINPLDGETGIGDVQIGGLYNFYAAQNFSLSAGGGIKLPTGKFKDVPKGKRATGGGVLDAGLRFNFDYKLFPWLVFSLQHQLETMLASGKKNKSSSIFNDRLNTGDPTIPAAIAIGGDGQPNEQKFERTGTGHDGFIRFGFGLTDLGEAFKPVGVGLKYRWKEGRETRYDGEAIDSNGWRRDEITRMRFAGFNISWDGLGLKPLIPLSINYEYEMPVSGEFATIAPITNRFQIIGYYKF